MANDVHSLLLFPEAFVILVLSNLYLVTRDALVPEMVVAENARRAASTADGDPWAPTAQGRPPPGRRDRRPMAGRATGRGSPTRGSRRRSSSRSSTPG